MVPNFSREGSNPVTSLQRQINPSYGKDSDPRSEVEDFLQVFELFRLAVLTIDETQISQFNCMIFVYKHFGLNLTPEKRVFRKYEALQIFLQIQHNRNDVGGTLNDISLRSQFSAQFH